ncbi:TOBE domain-containing protein [uncultured Aquimarina sp.]|uniref:TOBE domain-containing protein n=1 Tax=uncultured Aquimarina sp. TaxID=575652 RepID=UPI002630AF73|nr:TOBE domain-containing protein [uncultured Aquimarina sp.]
MNTFSGHISDIQVNESLSMVSIRINEHIVFKTILVETPETASYLKNGSIVDVLFKETEVIISTEDTLLISVQNKIKGTIKKIKRGVLLSRLIVTTEIGDIVAIIATEALDTLLLKENSTVIAMIKVNEIMLSR